MTDASRAHIGAFDVAPDGTLSDGRIFAGNIGTGDYDEGSSTG